MSDDNVFAQLESKFRRLAELRVERDQSKTANQKAEKEYRSYEAELIAELAESKTKGTHSFDFGGDLGEMKFISKKTVYGQVVDHQLAAAYFASEEGEASSQTTEVMYEPKIIGRRLNEIARECHEDGGEFPPGIGFYEKKFISISGA